MTTDNSVLHAHLHQHLLCPIPSFNACPSTPLFLSLFKPIYSLCFPAMPVSLSHSLFCHISSLSQMHIAVCPLFQLCMFRRRKVCLTLSGDIQGDSDEASASQNLLKEVVTWAVPARMMNLGLTRSGRSATLPPDNQHPTCACSHVAKHVP